MSIPDSTEGREQLRQELLRERYGPIAWHERASQAAQERKEASQRKRASAAA